MSDLADFRKGWRKFWKFLYHFVFGKNIFQVFLRVYLLTVIILSVFLYSGLTHTEWDFPPITPGGKSHPYTYWSALFIACSAFSTTGLTPVNISTFFNFGGQFIIFITFILGGVGIISLFYVFWNLFRKNDAIKMNQIILMQSERGTSKLSTSFKSIRFSVIFIFICGIVFGFIISLWLCFYPSYVQDNNGSYGGQPFNSLISWDTPQLINAYHNYPKALWQAMFCSFSGLNNVGFDVFESNVSLASFRNDGNIFFQFLTMLEIVIGGIGYPLIFDIYEKIKAKRLNLKHNFSLFSKVSVLMYCILFSFSLLVAIGFEYGTPNSSSLLNVFNRNDANTITTIPESWALDDGYVVRPWGKGVGFNKFWSIVYNTVSTRSTGFSTVDQGLYTEGSRLTFTFMMFIGASPSSTGGGIRTTTFAVLIMHWCSVIINKKEVIIFKKKIPESTVHQASLVFFTALTLILLSTVIIFFTPNAENPSQLIGETYKWNFMHVLYDVTSSFGTVGLNVGLTNLSGTSSLMILVICMFIGQLGISPTILAWGKRLKYSHFVSYGEENIKIG